MNQTLIVTDANANGSIPLNFRAAVTEAALKISAGAALMLSISLKATLEEGMIKTVLNNITGTLVFRSSSWIFFLNLSPNSHLIRYHNKHRLGILKKKKWC